MIKKELYHPPLSPYIYVRGSKVYKKAVLAVPIIMTEVYRGQALRKHIHNSIQSGGSFVGNKYFYNALDPQTGGGIGGIFKSLFKFASPLIKSGSKQLAIKGREILEPQVKKLVKSGVSAGERWATDKIAEASDKVTKKFDSIGKKRKRDTLDD